MLQANRLNILPTNRLAAPSHARVRIIHRSNGRAHPICGLRPVPDLPAGRFLHKMAIGPKHERWRRRPPASLQAGRRGATTGFAPPVTAQRWTCIEHGRPRALPAAKNETFHSLHEMDPWIWNSRVLQKRSVRPPPPVSDRPNISALPATLHSRLTSRLPVLAPAGAQARAAWRRLQSAETHFWRGCAPCKALSEIEVASLADLLTCFKNIHLFSRTFKCTNGFFSPPR